MDSRNKEIEKQQLLELHEFVKSPSNDLESKYKKMSNILKIKNAKELLEIIIHEDFEMEFYTISDFQTADSIGVNAFKSYLINPCLICKSSHPKDNIVYFNCSHFLCNDCFDGWFTERIKTREVADWVCPVCKLDPANDNPTREELKQHLDFLNLIVQSRASLKEELTTFLTKLSIFAATEDDHFIWCSHGCDYGFIYQGKNNPITCPSCDKKTCIHCRQKWTDVHRGKTCEQFMLATDENVAALMKDTGVFCPNCKTPCEIIAGGCLHISCVYCSAEYCVGCRGVFFTKAKPCAVKDHKGLQFHAHHPRNCAYFLRDWSVERLKEVLKSKKVDYTKKVVKNGENDKQPRCGVTVANKGENGLIEGRCTKQLVELEMCEEHLKLYLIRLINKHNIEPLDFMTRDELIVYMKMNPFEVIKPPKQPASESTEAFKKRLIELIQNKIPLQKLFLA